MAPYILAGIVLLGYAAALWWLLRRESMGVFFGLAILCGISLALRLVYTGDYPVGYNGDELSKFIGAVHALRSNLLFTVDRSGWPVLLNVLFQAPLVPVVGPTRWAIRSYSHVTSVLSTPLAFAALRGLGLGVVPGFASAALVAVLPWSIFYGRVSSGGELIFHELLVVTVLARLAWGTGGWVEAAIGALGLTGLLYDYGCGRVVLVLPVVAALLARTRRARLLCVAIPAVALLAWVPFLTHNPGWLLETSFTHVRPEAYGSPVQLWFTGMRAALVALRLPGASDGWVTIRYAGVHPPVILACALLGFLVPSRVSVFLLAGFLAGVAPVTITDNAAPSAHRMLMAFPFVALAAGRVFELIKWRTVQAAAVLVVVTLAAVSSMQLYFSPEFWPGESRSQFSAEVTALMEAIPIPAPMRLVLMRQLGPGDEPRMLVDPQYELLTVENWFPPKGGRVMYGFSAHAPELRPFYENLVGYGRVSAFGRAFLVTLEAADWSWMRLHGWGYEARCGDMFRYGEVPALFHPVVTFGDLRCSGRLTNVWRGHWNGPETPVRVLFSGDLTVDTPAGRLVEKAGTEAAASFTLPSDTDLTVTLVTFGAPSIALVEVTPAGDRVPVWERVTPLLSCPLDSGPMVRGGAPTK